MIDPNTPIMPGALKIWEREVAAATELLAAAQRRLDFANKYLSEVKAKVNGS